MTAHRSVAAVRPRGPITSDVERQLLSRPDAEATLARLARQGLDDLGVTLTALAVLSARAAAERLEETQR